MADISGKFQLLDRFGLAGEPGDREAGSFIII
jgi:hypothetical protein